MSRPRPPLPPPAYLLAMLRDALHRHEAALPSATAIQRFVWREVSRGIFIGTWPFESPNTWTTEIISCAMHRVIAKGWPVEVALKEALRIMR